MFNFKGVKVCLQPDVYLIGFYVAFTGLRVALDNVPRTERAGGEVSGLDIVGKKSF